MRPFGGPSVWLEFSPLARLTSSINLGQGAPGWSPPSFLTDALEKAARSETHSQYSRSAGAPELVREIARIYAPKITPPSLQPLINPEKQVLVTVGASQALSLACTALLDPGDEALLIEPAFDIYTGAVRLAGAKPVSVPLRPLDGSLHLDLNELSEALSSRTRLLILNSPHNPTGKVFSRNELRGIADVLDERAPSCVVLSDEVYEHLVFGREHVPFASVSRTAYQRTLSIYSAGKTFSSTGLKVGWVIGSDQLIRELQLAQQFVVFCINHMSQVAIAEALKAAEQPFEGFGSYYAWLCDRYKNKRDFLIRAIEGAGMEPMIPDGSFYIIARVPEGHRLRERSGIPDGYLELVEQRGLEVDPSTYGRGDYNISRRLVLDGGVATIPTSAFFDPDNMNGKELANGYIRFAFCHPDEVLAKAADQLRRYGG